MIRIAKPDSQRVIRQLADKLGTGLADAIRFAVALHVRSITGSTPSWRAPLKGKMRKRPAPVGATSVNLADSELEAHIRALADGERMSLTDFIHDVTRRAMDADSEIAKAAIEIGATEAARAKRASRGSRSDKRTRDIEIGALISARRRGLGLTRAEVAAELDMSAKRLEHFERGRDSLRLVDIDQLCRVLQVDPLFFFPVEH
jgi:hypothetical protein